MLRIIPYRLNERFYDDESKFKGKSHIKTNYEMVMGPSDTLVCFMKICMTEGILKAMQFLPCQGTVVVKIVHGIYTVDGDIRIFNPVYRSMLDDYIRQLHLFLAEFPKDLSGEYEATITAAVEMPIITITNTSEEIPFNELDTEEQDPLSE